MIKPSAGFIGMTYRITLFVVVCPTSLNHGFPFGAGNRAYIRTSGSIRTPVTIHFPANIGIAAKAFRVTAKITRLARVNQGFSIQTPTTFQQSPSRSKSRTVTFVTKRTPISRLSFARRRGISDNPSTTT